MGALVNREEALKKLLQAINSKDEAKIINAKYAYLFEAANLLEVVANYVILNKMGIHFDYGKSIIKKGQKFYRIRNHDETTDFSKLNEWLPPPSRPQNRANRSGQSALYLGSTELVCLLETHMKNGETYVLGTYACMEDVEVGGFFSFDKNNQLHNIAGIILNAFLIAPSRCEKNSELFEYLDKHYGKITPDDLSSIKNNILDAFQEYQLPYQFGVLNQNDELYNLTNEICDILSTSFPSGIRYSSCFIPAETIGISCSDYNLVLYEPAIEKMKFLSYEIKHFGDNNVSELTDVNITKAYLERSNSIEKRT